MFVQILLGKNKLKGFGILGTLGRYFEDVTSQFAMLRFSAVAKYKNPQMTKCTLVFVYCNLML